MQSVYRGTQSPADSEEVPDFGNRPRLRVQITWVAAHLLVWVAAVAVWPTEEMKLRAMLYGTGYVLSIAIILLEAPFRAWLEARRARAVVRGIAELEAKAEALSARD